MSLSRCLSANGLVTALAVVFSGICTADELTDIHLWPVTLVDGSTKKPLPGVEVEVTGARAGDDDRHAMTLISDDAGQIEIPLRPGTASIVHVTSAGWCTEGFTLIGDIDFDNDGKLESAPRDKPRSIPLWKGTVVTGTLLTPDGKPAAGIALQAGVYISNPPWPQTEPRVWQSWDHGQWPNWDNSTKTSADGIFHVTVPPASARSWIRVSTFHTGFGAIDTAELAEEHREHALVKYAPFEVEVNHKDEALLADEATGAVNLGTLQLDKGVILKGRVVDAGGNPLAGVYLLTSNRHGPYAGRKTVSRADGSYEFQPFSPGTFTLSVDARYRDAEGKVNSRDEQAVFLKHEVTLGEKNDVVELTVQAVPHVELEFEWVDRRAEKGPVSYYGEFKIAGQVPNAAGDLVWWRGVTEKIERDGKEYLIVKVPINIENPELTLVADSRVTASYEDDDMKSGPGRIPLGDVTQLKRRVIYGDEPRER